MCKIDRKSEKVCRQMHVNVFLPSISWCISRWTFCTRVDRQRSPHPGSALWVSSASGVRCFGARKCRWSRMFSLSYGTENGEDKKNKFDLLDKMTVMFHSPISSSSSDTYGFRCLKMEICTMWRTSFFSRLHTMCAVRSRRESTRGRTVQGGLDVPFCFGRTLLVSGLIPEAFMSRTWQCRCCCPSYHDGGKRRTKDKKKMPRMRDGDLTEWMKTMISLLKWMIPSHLLWEMTGRIGVWMIPDGRVVNQPKRE